MKVPLKNCKLKINLYYIPSGDYACEKIYHWPFSPLMVSSICNLKLTYYMFGKNDSQVGSQPLAGTRESLSRHLHFIWDTPQSFVFHFNYTCHSLVPFSFTLLSLVGHLISKASSECFNTDLSGLEGQLLQSIH